MQDIVNFLGPFFEVTEVLGSSEYATFSYMIPSILGLMEKLDCSMKYSDELDYVNFETTDLVFDDNVEFVMHKKRMKNALYNALLHYWDLSDNELFLACLLDPRFKKLRFATSTQQLQAKAAL
ncbi:hypothetical protein C2G38_2167669 [Gigaspora rosea]|uniref:hAT-like transposase RNase-H fold domain-containing protein n=1 Tax=Gigaspora rosea TaxID=44941 RepID=A0A397VXS0_9GLOM|nr:hypothetical protein C2G38_2167669 [Gigaspora rosea]